MRTCAHHSGGQPSVVSCERGHRRRGRRLSWRRRSICRGPCPLATCQCARPQPGPPAPAYISPTNQNLPPRTSHSPQMARPPERKTLIMQSINHTTPNGLNPTFEPRKIASKHFVSVYQSVSNDGSLAGSQVQSPRCIATVDFQKIHPKTSKAPSRNSPGSYP